MKKQTLLFAVITLLFTSLVQAEMLLSCNPPYGSGLQEVQIIQQDGKILRRELNFAGSFSALVEVSKTAWNQKDLRWSSRSGGQIHMKLIQDESGSYWSYTSQSYGVSVTGYCEQ